ncbi:hypothetical protein DLH72_04645 [Candidatus Gracilibacteria bacterium]|nr:MAG: hypothetical protein DLH72_04645 [Candidatus Gracilibacteria bacterium]
MFENKKFVTTARAIVLNAENKVLLVKHRFDGKWVLPGGHRENDESPHETIVRELREEFQIKVEFLGKNFETKDSGIKILPLPFDNYIVSGIFNGQEKNIVEYIFLVKNLREKLVPLENEIFAFAWFSFDEILEENFDCFPRLKESIERIKNF